MKEDRFPRLSVGKPRVVVIPKNNRKHVAAVELQVRPRLRTGHGEVGGEHVDQVDRRVADAAGFDARPADDERDPQPALVDFQFPAAQRGVVGDPFPLALAVTLLDRRRGGTAVVGAEHDIGVVDQLVTRVARVIGFLEVGQDLADLPVEAVDHGGIIRIGLARRFGLGDQPGIGRERHAQFLAVMRQPFAVAGGERAVDQ